MDRNGHTEETKFFVGTEVEHSPAHGQRTLFVVGLQPKQEILARALNNRCPHIYLGANQSFDPDLGDSEKLIQWDNLCIDLLRDGIWVTLDFDVKYAETILEGGMTEYDTFIPMISVKLPYINQLNYNATLKLDDKDFMASNPGVWCHSVHDLKDRTKFTDWTKYTQDEIIE